MLIYNIETLFNLTKKIKEIVISPNDLSNFNVTIKIDDKMLKKLNEEFYYRNNPSTKYEDFNNIDEINVNINDISFKFIKKED